MCVATADMDMGNRRSGSPLLQMMAYANIKQEQESLPSPKLNVSAVKFFVDNKTGKLYTDVCICGSTYTSGCMVDGLGATAAH